MCNTFASEGSDMDQTSVRDLKINLDFSLISDFNFKIQSSAFFFFTSNYHVIHYNEVELTSRTIINLSILLIY